MIAFPDHNSNLGDSLNFPESGSVKKKEALSNVIFRITQSSEKLRLQQERLLELNFKYEQRMQELDFKKEEEISNKLRRERAFYKRNAYNNWLGDDNNKLPGMPMADAYSKGLVARKAALDDRSLNHQDHQDSSVSFKDKDINDDARNGLKMKGKMDRGDGGFLVRKVTGISIHDDDAARGTNDAATYGLTRRDTNQNNMTSKSEQSVLAQTIIDRNRRLAKLLRAAKEWSENSSAFIPVDPSSYHMCSTRRKYSGNDQTRILTKYFREKKEMEKITSKSNESLPKIRNIKSRITGLSATPPSTGQKEFLESREAKHNSILRKKAF